MTAGLCAGMTWLANVSESVLAIPLTVLVAVLLAAAAVAARPCDAGRRSRGRARRGYESALVTEAACSSGRAGVRVPEVCPRPLRRRRHRRRLRPLDRRRRRGALTGKGSTTPVLPLLHGPPSTRGSSTSPSSQRSCGPPRSVVESQGTPLESPRVGALGTQPSPPSAGRQRPPSPLEAWRRGVWQARWPSSSCGRCGSGSAGRPPASAGTTRVADRWLALVPVVFVAALALANVQGVARRTCSLEAFRSEVDRVLRIVAEDDVAAEPAARAGTGRAARCRSSSAGREAGMTSTRARLAPFSPSSARDQLRRRVHVADG